MRIHFATSPGKKYFGFLKKYEVKNALISFNFIKNPNTLLKIMNGYTPKNFIIDSGAFSVWANGQTIDLEAYTRFCKQCKEILPSEINLYIVNLDVLPGKFGERPTETQIEESAKQGWENMLRLESEGLKVIHVFHQHENWEWLERMRAHSDYIGISPANDVSMKEKINFLRQVFSKIKGTIKTHGFAVTSHHQVYNFPFFSVDSSSWVAPARFGRIPVFCDDLTMKSFQYKDKEQVIKYWDYIKSIGIDFLADDNYETRIALSIKSFQKLESNATKLWNNRGIVFNE